MRQQNMLAIGTGLLISVLMADAASAYYSPSMGRFLNRDPINEPGANLVRQAARPATAFIPRDPINEPGAVLVRRTVNQTTQFIPRDPVSRNLDINVYAYVSNDPCDKVDHLGLFSQIIGCSQSQQNQITAAHAQTKSHINNLTASINAAIPNDSGQYPWFTAAKLNRAKQYLSCANRQLDNLKADCCPARGMCSGSYAWVNWIFARTVHICPAFFNNIPSQYGRSTFQGATLVHEATHKCGTNDITYFWQNGDSPHDVGLGFCAYQDIASTYDTWILEGFCIPGYNCP